MNKKKQQKDTRYSKIVDLSKKKHHFRFILLTFNKRERVNFLTKSVNSKIDKN